MKFVLFCDVLQAPGDPTKPTVGVRLSGAAVRPTGETDDEFKAKLDALFNAVRGKEPPKPGDAGFDGYLDSLAQGAGPLFPWLGGQLEFSFLWASALPNAVPDPADIDPNGFTVAPLPLPTDPDAAHKANFELTDASWRALLYAAIKDVASSTNPAHTDRFNNVEPFRMVGFDDTNGGRQRIEVVDDATPNFRYEAFFAGLASLPAPIPHGRLNLVRFVQLNSIKAAPAGKTVLLVAAPRFKPRATATELEPKFGDAANPAVGWKLVEPNIVATIPYKTGFGGHEIEVLCRPLHINEDPGNRNSFIERKSLWVKRSQSSSIDSRDGIAFEDWLARLPEQLADAFDLPRLLAQAMEYDAKVAGTPLAAALAGADRKDGTERLTEAVLIALRDQVGPGCIATSTGVLTGANGSPAHAAILDRVNRIIGAGSRSAIALTEQELKTLADGVIKHDVDFRTAFGTGSGNDQRAEWIGMLAKVIGPTLNLPAGAEFLKELAARVAIDEHAKGALDPAPLRRAIDAATASGAAAALQIAIWRNAAPAQPKYEAWLSAAEAAFTTLFDRGFRLVEILKKANIDLPWDAKDGIWKIASNSSTRDTEVLAGSDTEQGNIREAITGYLHGTVCESGAGAPSSVEPDYQALHGRMGRLPAAARTKVAEAVDAAARTRMKDWFKAPAAEQGTDTLLKGGLAADAHGVMLQIDRLVVGAGVDFNENLAGFGLLMRRSRPLDDWRCLTASFAELDPDGTPMPVTFETAPRSVLGALPVSYTSQMPQAIVTYDNRPIVGDSQADVETEPQPEDKPHPRMIRLVQPTVQDNPPAETLLPFLAYGATYEVAPFGISNQSALPVDIRRDDFPGMLDPAKLKDGLFPASSDVVRRFSYVRRTGIGSLRVAPFFAPAQQAGKLFHPMVAPRDTKLVADELLVPSQAVEPWTTPGAVRALKMKTALLLSDDKGDALVIEPEHVDCGELKLKVAAPLTTLEDFDRWIAFDEATLSAGDKDKLRAFRKKVRSFQLEQTAALHERETALQEAIAGPRRDSVTESRLRTEIEAIRPLLDLQDPAVGALGISVTRVRRDGALTADAVASHQPELFEWTWKWQPGSDPKNPFAAGRLPIEVTCKLSKDRSKPLFDKTTRTVWSAPGDVVIVRLFAGIDDAYFTGQIEPAGKRRFDASVRDVSIGAGADTAVVTGNGGVKYRLLSTHAFAVEAASFAIPSDVDLGAAVSGNIVGEVPDATDERPGDIRLQFKRKPSAAADALGSVTVGSQAWRWTGRPLSPFPFDKIADLNVFPNQDPIDPLNSPPPSPTEHALLWDMEGFAERLGETLDDDPALLPPNEQIDIKTNPPTSAPLSIRVALRSPNRTEVMRYMRFRVVGLNRYAAAYKAARKDVDSVPAILKNANGKWQTPWFRIARPAAIPASIPRPGIRALIPLTRALQEGDLSPVSGVLAVVDGAWFEHAGLADWLLAGVENAYRKKLMIDHQSTPTPAAASEIGPDPLVRTYGLGQKLGTTPTKIEELRTAVPLAVVGPLGHSFDTGTATGLFLNSSFIVRAPDLAEQDPAGWWMGKLAFRRIVLAEGTSGYLASTEGPSIKSSAAQIGATLPIIEASGSLTFNATGKLSWDGPAKADAAVRVKADRNGAVWNVEVEDLTLHMKDSFSISEAAFDLRVIAVRRISRAPDKPDQYVWYEILLLVKPQNRNWEIVWQTQWFNDPKFAENKDPVKAELEITFEIDPTSNAKVGELRTTTILQVSEATEGRWVQFLPNMQTLARSASVDLRSLQLSVDPGSKQQLLLSAKGEQEFAWLATNALKANRGKNDQGLFNLLLLTRRVASVSGTDEEAYVGLYDSATGYDTGRKAVVLTWFDRGPPRTLDDRSKLIGRILTVRAGKPSVSDVQIAAWKSDPWKAFFPAENSMEEVDPLQVFGGLKPSDASAQIIEVYSPVFAT